MIAMPILITTSITITVTKTTTITITSAIAIAITITRSFLLGFEKCANKNNNLFRVSAPVSSQHRSPTANSKSVVWVNVG